MSENLVLDLSMQFAIDIVNLCDSIKGKSAIISEEVYKKLKNDCGKIRKLLISSINTAKANS